MTTEQLSVKEMWKNYLLRIGESIDDTDKGYESWSFCDNKLDANELSDLVKSGVKCATTSLFLCYEVENEPIPKVGDLSIVTDWEGMAQSVIEIIKVEVISFNDVTREFAYKEGEGDRSLSHWRRVHIDFFSRVTADLHKEFNQEMLVVCEEFKLVNK